MNQQVSKVRWFLLTVVLQTCIYSYGTYAQDGKIIEKIVFKESDTTGFGFYNISVPENYNEILEGVEMSHITYLSDGLKIKGYMAIPKKPGKYPCIIYSRGGVRNFGAMNHVFAQRIMGEMANWGYVVVESQLRGCAGSEGQEAIGGKEINDVLNLIPLLATINQADTSRIGIFGRSRGGHTVYHALAESANIDAAVVIGGMANFFQSFSARPEIDSIYCPLIPNCSMNREKAIRQASPTFWAEKLNESTPILIMHGADDQRVPPEEALEMLEKLYQQDHPVRFVFFENGDHGLTEYRKETDRLTKYWLDKYLKRID